MSIIKSMRETVGIDYKRPDEKKIDEYIETLNNNDKAQDYLRNERGLSDESIKHFKLGYDAKRDAISIPIYKRGELINVKYRFLNPKKQKYSSEYGAETWIFNDEGIDLGLKKGGVLVVEGEFDLMSAWQVGFKNVVSPAFGKDSFGIWIEQLDNIPKIYIAYDNDEGGKTSALKMAERLGIDKSFEVCYPQEIKDANEFFKSYTKEDYRELLENAKPYYNYQFKGLGDIIESLRTPTKNSIMTKFFPNVTMEKDWLVVVSGKTNSGKTSYVLNVANDILDQDTPVLIMPFERGIDAVGKRFMNVRYDKTNEDFSFTDESGWKDIIDDCIKKPLYFAVPKKEEIIDTIIKSKRLFDTKVVIVDHLDYLVRHVGGSREAEISNTLQNLKRIGEEHGIIIVIVTHIRKIENAGATLERKPNLDDLKGSSSLSQDPECVILINQHEDGVEVNVAKNKGEMRSEVFSFKPETGRMGDTDFTKFGKELMEISELEDPLITDAVSNF